MLDDTPESLSQRVRQLEGRTLGGNARASASSQLWRQYPWRAKRNRPTR
jgi:hypothetical protein